MSNQIISPAIESLFFAQDDFIWPREVRNNLELRRQTKARSLLCKNLDYLFKWLVIFNFSLERTLNNHQIDLDKITAIYQGLSDFFESDFFNRRLILYLPFELIPEADLEVKSEKLIQVLNNFRKVYLENWRELLKMHDPRANFLDGDILEPELSLSAPEMVSKAAHLIPLLMQKKLISFPEVVSLIENSSDEILINSILDTFSVMLDLGLPVDFDLLVNSKNYWLRNMAVIISDQPPVISHLEAKFSTIRDEGGLELLLSKFQQEINQVESGCQADFASFPARLIWEQKKQTRKVLEKYAFLISGSLMAGSLSARCFKNYFCLASNSNSVSKLLVIYSLKIMIEKIAAANLSRARRDSLGFKDWLQEINQEADSATGEALQSILLRWFNAGIIDQSYLNYFDLKPVKLDAFFSASKVGLDGALDHLFQVISQIKQETALANILYPVFIIHGSRIKEHALNGADLDLAVFVKPGVTFDNYDYIKETLAGLLKHEKLKGPVLQFWLHEENHQLQISDFEAQDKLVANSYFVHVLFGGAWLGEKRIIKRLYNEVLTGYLTETSELKRNIYLKELERTTIQYRLMHKAYANFYPERSRVNTDHAKDIDALSSFYDSGYRELAAKLFIKKIFLPRISV